MTREEAIQQIKSHISYAEFCARHGHNDKDVEKAHDDIEAFRMAIDALSVEDDWISCSERLPEIDETLRLCDQISEEILGTDNYGNIRHVYLTNCGYLKPTFCTAEEGMSVDIVAWMPLPKPYKGGDE